ncbi:MAG: hypothetical protein AABW47_03635 [Nanoarchaeota archaeon]
MLESSLKSLNQELPIAEGIYVCPKISKKTNGIAIPVSQNKVYCQYVGGNKCLTNERDISLEEYLREEVLKESPFFHEEACSVWVSAHARQIALSKP